VAEAHSRSETFADIEIERLSILLRYFHRTTLRDESLTAASYTLARYHSAISSLVASHTRTVCYPRCSLPGRRCYPSVRTQKALRRRHSVTTSTHSRNFGEPRARIVRTGMLG
jgi:hypothetical protein